MEMICSDALYLFTMSQPRLGGGGGSEGAEDEKMPCGSSHLREKGNRIREIGASVAKLR